MSPELAALSISIQQKWEYIRINDSVNKNLTKNGKRTQT